MAPATPKQNDEYEEQAADTAPAATGAAHPPKKSADIIPLAARTEMPHRGMPPFDPTGPSISFFEFWPTRVFYLPIALYWGWLALRYGGITTPTLANPLFPVGGLVGESKSKILDHISGVAPYVARHVSVTATQDSTRDAADGLRALADIGIALPVVAKPDMGCRGVGVRLIETPDELTSYFSDFPDGEPVVLQEYVPFEAEAGIFYVRHPDAESGQIISMTLKYFPHVIGDGSSTLRELIAADKRAGKISHIYLPRHAERLDLVLPKGQPYRLAFAGSHSRGTIFRDGNAFITEAMRQKFDKISRAIPEFYFGRFDVRFKDIESLQAGKDFKIVEVNGAGGEATHIWDRNTSLKDAYRTLMNQYDLLFQIGRRNRQRGFKAIAPWTLFSHYLKEKRLTGHYPTTQ
ncbi:MAG: D-alanine--D-alanine ligase [Pseudomonadota bacterium]